MSRGFASAAAVAEVVKTSVTANAVALQRLKTNFPRAQSRQGRPSGGKIATCGNFLARSQRRFLTA